MYLIIPKEVNKFLIILIKTLYTIYKYEKEHSNINTICISCNHIRTRTPALIIGYNILFEGESYYNMNKKINSQEYIKKYSSDKSNCNGVWDRNNRIKNGIIYLDIIAKTLNNDKTKIIKFIEGVLSDKKEDIEKIFLNKWTDSRVQSIGGSLSTSSEAAAKIKKAL